MPRAWLLVTLASLAASLAPLKSFGKTKGRGIRIQDKKGNKNEAVVELFLGTAELETATVGGFTRSQKCVKVDGCAIYGEMNDQDVTRFSGCLGVICPFAAITVARDATDTRKLADALEAARRGAYAVGAEKVSGDAKEGPMGGAYKTLEKARGAVGIFGLDENVAAPKNPLEGLKAPELANPLETLRDWNRRPGRPPRRRPRWPRRPPRRKRRRRRPRRSSRRCGTAGRLRRGTLREKQECDRGRRRPEAELLGGREAHGVEARGGRGGGGRPKPSRRRRRRRDRAAIGGRDSAIAARARRGRGRRRGRARGDRGGRGARAEAEAEQQAEAEARKAAEASARAERDGPAPHRRQPPPEDRHKLPPRAARSQSQAEDGREGAHLLDMRKMRPRWTIT